VERSDAAVEDVVVLTATVVEDARRALAALQRLHEAGDIRLSAGAVVGRRPDGRTFAVEQRAAHPTASAGVGAAADVRELLRGPFGVVFEHAPDALVGSLVDIADLDKSDRLLRCFGPAVPEGCMATIALVSETTPESIEALAARLDVGLTKRSREEVETDLDGEVAPAAGTPQAAGEVGRRQGVIARARAAFSRRR